MMVYGDSPDQRVKTIPVQKRMQNRFCLDEPAILKLASWIAKIEDYYSR